MICPDKIIENTESCDCVHYRWIKDCAICTLSQYLTCIETQSQIQNQPQNQNLISTQNARQPTPTLANGVAPAGSIILPRLSYSAMQSHAHCHRKYWWEYIIRIVSIDTPIAMLKGTIGHEIVQYIHTAQQPELAGINNIVDGSQDLLSSTPRPTLEALKALGWAYLELDQYSSFHGRAEHHFETKGEPVVHGYLDFVQYEEGEK